MKKLFYVRTCRLFHAWLFVAFMDFGGFFVGLQAQTPAENIKLGLLIHDKADTVCLQAAKLAVGTTNTTSGCDHHFLLETRSCEGPWGQGAKRAVELMMEEEVPVLVGALDGRNAHLAEQVSAKARVTLISTRATDVTLSEAFVPWYFRLIPNDRQQAADITQEIYAKNKHARVTVLLSNTYDGRQSAAALQKEVQRVGGLPPTLLTLDDLDNLAQKIAKNPCDVMVMAGPLAKEDIEKICTLAGDKTLFGFLNVLNHQRALPAGIMEKIAFFDLPDRQSLAYQKFETAFQHRFGYAPSPTAAFVYDGVMLAAAAVCRYGADPPTIRKQMPHITHAGASGNITFQQDGSRRMAK